MRHGICILPEHAWRDAEPLWRRAEQLGFDHAWTYDHLVWAGLPDSPWHSTVATLTAAAMVTDRIRLGTFVASPNFRHPVTFTRDVLTLDDISAGRLVLGLGAGGDLDAGILGLQLTRGQRTRRFREFVELLDRTLTHDHVDHDGEFFSAVDARSLPGCVQQPRVPFVVAANGPRGMALALEHGAGWMTTGASTAAAEGQGDAARHEAFWAGTAELVRTFERELEESGRDPAGIDRYLSLDTDGRSVLTSAATYREEVERAEQLGFTDVIVHWPRAAAPYDGSLEVLEQVAPAATGRA